MALLCADSEACVFVHVHACVFVSVCVRVHVCARVPVRKGSSLATATASLDFFFLPVFTLCS